MRGRVVVRANQRLWFIEAEVTQDDILLHAIVLRNLYQGSVVDNARIEFIAQETTKGVQATVAM